MFTQSYPMSTTQKFLLATQNEFERDCMKIVLLANCTIVSTNH